MTTRRKDPRGGKRDNPKAFGHPENPHRLDNLKKTDPEKFEQIISKANEKRREGARKRREMKESLEVLLDMAVRTGPVSNLEDLDNLEDLEKANLSVQEKLMISMIRKGLAGSIQANEFLRDTVGEKPVERQEHTEVKPVILTGEDELPE